MKKILCKLNLDTVIEDYSITFMGVVPKLCTAYIYSDNFILIPIRELMKQGVSLHYQNDDWFDKGDKLCEGKPCKFFSISEVDILCSS